MVGYLGVKPKSVVKELEKTCGTHAMFSYLQEVFDNDIEKAR